MVNTVHLDWATASRYPMWCVTFTRNVTSAEVLRRYGANPEDARMRTHADNRDLYEMAAVSGTVLRSGTLSGWSFCYEDMHIFGSRPGVLASLSQATETLSLLRGGDGMNSFTVWRDGQREELFEPGAPSVRPHYEGQLYDLVQRYRTDQSGLVTALQAIAHYTGVMLDDATVSGPLLTVHLPEAEQARQPFYPSSPKDGSRALGQGLGFLRPAPSGQGSASLDQLP